LLLVDYFYPLGDLKRDKIILEYFYPLFSVIISAGEIADLTGFWKSFHGKKVSKYKIIIITE